MLIPSGIVVSLASSGRKPVSAEAHITKHSEGGEELFDGYIDME